LTRARACAMARFRTKQTRFVCDGQSHGRKTAYAAYAAVHAHSSPESSRNRQRSRHRFSALAYHRRFDRGFAVYLRFAVRLQPVIACDPLDGCTDRVNKKNATTRHGRCAGPQQQRYNFHRSGDGEETWHVRTRQPSLAGLGAPVGFGETRVGLPQTSGRLRRPLRRTVRTSSCGQIPEEKVRHIEYHKRLLALGGSLSQTAAQSYGSAPTKLTYVSLL